MDDFYLILAYTCFLTLPTMSMWYASHLQNKEQNKHHFPSKERMTNTLGNFYKTAAAETEQASALILRFVLPLWALITSFCFYNVFQGA